MKLNEVNISNFSPDGISSKFLFAFSIIFSIGLLTAALLWVVYVAPYLTRLPDNFTYSADVVSTDNFYDVEEQKFFGETVSSTKFFYGVDSKEGNNVVIRSVFDVRKLSGEEIFSVERNYGINQISRQHVKGLGDEDREGYLFAPRGLSKTSYYYWHVNYDTPILMEFVSEDEVDGVLVYRFNGDFHADQTKELGDMVDVGEKFGINLDGRIDLWVEPLTGRLIKYSDSATAYYYDIQTGERLYPWNQFSNRFTEDSAVQQARIAQGYIQGVYLVEIIVPAGFVFLALVLLLVVYANRNILRGSTTPDRVNTTFGVPNYMILSIPIAFLVATVVLWKIIEQRVIIDQQNVFESKTAEVETDILRRTEIYRNALESLQAFYSGSNDVTRDEWKAFVEDADMLENYPGIQGLGYAAYFTSDEKDDLVSSIKAEGYSDFKVLPEGDRNEYTSVIYLEPFEGKNLRAFGYDMLTEEVRKEALSKARDTGNVILSGKVRLVQETDENAQPGFLMYAPVYKKGLPVETQKEKFAALQGYVYAPFRAYDFIESILDYESTPLYFAIYDGNIISQETLLFEHDKSDIGTSVGATRYEKKKEIYIGEHLWTIVFKDFYNVNENNIDSVLPGGVLFAGTGFSLILFFFLYLLVTTRTSALRYAQNLTGDLERINAKLIEAQHIAKVGNWEWDVKTNRVSWSDELFRIYGLTANQFEPTYDSFLKYLAPDDQALFDEAMKKALVEKSPFDLYYRIVRPDGEIRVIHARCEVDVDEKGVVLSISGTGHDVTSLKKAEEDLKKRTDDLEKLNASMVGREMKMIELKKEIDELKFKLKSLN